MHGHIQNISIDLMQVNFMMQKKRQEKIDLDSGNNLTPCHLGSGEK